MTVDKLPTPDDQVALCTAFADVLASGAADQAVNGPLIWPDDEWFPDAVEPDEDGVAVLLLRVLGYAGLDDVEVSVRLFDHNEDALAWWTVSDDDEVELWIDAEATEDADRLVGLLCRMVAGLWRLLHDLHEDDDDDEQRLIDVTGVALGFGAILANAADLTRTTGGLDGRWAWSTLTRSSLGALHPVQFAYLLAIQCHVRDDPAETKRMRGFLESNPRAAFDAARRSVTAAPPAISAGLIRRRPRAACEADWSALKAPYAFEPIAAGDAASFAAADVESAVGGAPTFAVWRNQTWTWAGLGGGVGVLGGLAGAAIAATPVVLGLGIAAGLGGGWAVGRQRSGWVCADPDCEAGLDEPDGTCPGCGRAVAGAIARADDRLDAEDRWRRERASD